jgi:hypothetical protein
MRRVGRSVAETYSEPGEGDIAEKNDIFDISHVIETPLTLILSPHFAGGEERKGSLGFFFQLFSGSLGGFSPEPRSSRLLPTSDEISRWNASRRDFSSAI